MALAQMRRVLAWLYGRPYFLLVLTMLMWGGNAVASRLAVGQVSPMALTFLPYHPSDFLAFGPPDVIGGDEP